MPFGPFALDLFDRLAQQGVGAVAEGRQRHVAELAAVDLLDAAGRDRQRDLGAGDLQLPGLAPSSGRDADRHLGPFRAFDLRRRDFAVDAGDRFAVDRDDHVAGLDPGLVGG